MTWRGAAARRRRLRAGQGDALPLAAGQVAPARVAVREHGVPAAREGVEQFGDAGTFGRAVQRRGVGFLAEQAEGYVAAQGQRVSRVVLEDDGHLALPLPGGQVGQRHAVDGYPPAAGVAQPGEQGHQGGLPGAVHPDQRSGLAGRQGQVDAGQDVGRGAGVAEADVLEAQFAAQGHRALGQAGRSVVCCDRDRDGGSGRAGKGIGVESGRVSGGGQVPFEVVQVRQGGEHQAQAEVGQGEHADRHAHREHGQHHGQRAQRDLVVQPLPAEQGAGAAVTEEDQHSHQGHPPVQHADLLPGRRHALDEQVPVAAHQPVPQAEDPQLGGRLRLEREADVVPAGPQRLGAAPVGGHPGGDHRAQRPAHQQPHDQQAQAQPPAEGAQDQAGEQSGEPVADLPGQGHRGVGQAVAGDLAAGPGQLVEHLGVLQVGDPGRGADRGDQALLDHLADPAADRGVEQVLGRAAQQGQGVQAAAQAERDPEPVRGGGVQPGLDRGRDRAAGPAERDHRGDRHQPFDQHEHDGQHAERAAGPPQQPAQPHPAAAADRGQHPARRQRPQVRSPAPPAFAGAGSGRLVGRAGWVLRGSGRAHRGSPSRWQSSESPPSRTAATGAPQSSFLRTPGWAGRFRRPQSAPRPGRRRRSAGPRQAGPAARSAPRAGAGPRPAPPGPRAGSRRRS